MSESAHFFQTFGIKIARHFRNYRVISTSSEHTNILLGHIIVPLNNLTIAQCTLRSDFDAIEPTALKSYLQSSRRNHDNIQNTLVNSLLSSSYCLENLGVVVQKTNLYYKVINI